MSRGKDYLRYFVNSIHHDNLLLPVIIIGAVILIVVTCSFRQQMDAAVYRNTVHTMEEVAQHDMQSLQDRFRDSELNLQIIANELRIDNCQSIEEAEKWLNARTDNNYFDRIGFIDDQYVMYRDDFKQISLRDDILKDFYQQNEKDFFVNVFDVAGNVVTSKDSYGVLLYAVKVEPIRVGEHTIIGVAAVNRITSIIDQIKISSFDGHGYSAIIEGNGNFLVDADYDKNISEKANLFDKIQQGQLLDGVTLENIKDSMQKGEKVVVRFFSKSGEDKVLLVAPMAESGRYFLMAVSYSFFKERSMTFTMMSTGFLLAVLAVIVVALSVTYRAIMSAVKSEADSRAQTAFLTNMSHEIRTPLNAIIGMNKVMGHHINDPERLKEYLKKSMDSSEYLMGLVNDILDVEAMNSGSFVISKEECNLQMMLENIRAMQGNKFQEKGIFYTEKFQLDHKRVITDGFRVGQVIMNLLSNACKFTNKDGSVVLSVWQEPTDNPAVVNTFIRCQDTGCGISEELHKKIFDYFVQDRDMNRESVKGTGLGLFICKKVIDGLKGTIKLESSLGNGAMFLISIPMEVLPDEKEPAIEEIAAAKPVLEENSKENIIEDFIAEKDNCDEDIDKNAFLMEDEDIIEENIFKKDKKEIDIEAELASLANVGTKPLHALIVEDNEMNYMILAELLTDLGVTTDWAMDGEEGYEMFRSAPAYKYDCIFMDIQMPIMNGHECTRKIRELDKEDAKTVYICACTANVYKQDEDNAYDSGMDDFMGKPVDMGMLMEILANVEK